MNMVRLLDGAVGTTLWGLADKAGVSRVPVWRYNVEHPELVEELHEKYIQAGSQMILTNTFGANGPMVRRVSKYSVPEIVGAGVRIARRVRGDRHVKLLCAIGPLSAFMEPYGDLEEEEVDAIFDEMISAADSEGVDGVMVQTFMDLDTACVAAKVAKRHGLPVFVTLSFEKNGRTIMGNTVPAVCRALENIGVDGVGMNCSFGPSTALPIIEAFSRTTKLPLVYKPNAGLPVTNPDGSVKVPYTAAQFAREIEPALDFVSYIGGCCNSDSEYVREIRALLESKNMYVTD